GNVAMSLPAQADSVVNCPPVSCIPSPESPAKRITARSKPLRGFSVPLTGATVSLIDPYPFLCRTPGAYPFRQVAPSGFAPDCVCRPPLLPSGQITRHFTGPRVNEQGLSHG